MRGLGCVLFALVGAVPAGLLALAWLLNVLYATPGGRTTISLAFLALVAGLAVVALRLVWVVLRSVWGLVAGRVVGPGRARRGGGLRPRGPGTVPRGIVPRVPYPYGDTGDGRAPSPGDGPPPEGDAPQRSGGPRGPAEVPGARRWLVTHAVPYGPADERPPRSYTTAILGQRGTGKSLALIDLAVSLLCGHPWWGLPGRHLSSFLVADLELDAEAFWERADAVGRGHGLPCAPGGLHYLSLYGDSLALPPPEAAARVREARCAAHGGLGSWLEAAAVWGRRRGIENRLTLRGATGLERLALRARRVRAQAVGIDSLTLGAMGAALSDPAGWNRLLAALEGLGVPLIVLDHLGKDGDAGAVGSFLKEARFRSVLTLRREAPGVLRVEHTKANFGPAVPSFRVRDVHGTDDAGRPVVTFTRAAEGGGDGPRPDSPDSPESPHDPAPRGAPLRPRRPVPRPLPAPRPALRVLPPAGAQGLQGPPESPPPRGERRVHQRIDAEVLAAVRAGTPAGRAALAAALPYAEKTVANSLARLRKAGALPRPAPRPVGSVVDAEGTGG